MENLIYFDNAATSFPKPISVLNATNDVIKNYCANPGRSSHPLAARAAEAVYECRSKLARLFDAEDENVVFTSSATHAINLGIKSTLRRGDHVLISDIEHNAVLRPISALAKRGLITFDVYRATDDPERLIRELASKIKANTSLICACHHSNICNLCLPARAIGHFCRKKGIVFLLDASQSAGCVPISVENDLIDILCAPAHKGLYGIPGLGFAIFGKSLSESGRLSTFIEGGNGMASESAYMPDFLPDRLEAGTLSLPAIVALSAGVDYVKRQGVDSISQKEKALCALLRRGLSRIKDVTVHSLTDGSILLFSVKGYTSEEFAQLLSRYGICVRAGLHCAPLAHRRIGTNEDGAVRVSLGAKNTPDQVRRFLTVCEKILSKRTER